MQSTRSISSTRDSAEAPAEEERKTRQLGALHLPPRSSPRSNAKSEPAAARQQNCANLFDTMLIIRTSARLAIRGDRTLCWGQQLTQKAHLSGPGSINWPRVCVSECVVRCFSRAIRSTTFRTRSHFRRRRICGAAGARRRPKVPPASSARRSDGSKSNEAAAPIGQTKAIIKLNAIK